MTSFFSSNVLENALRRPVSLMIATPPDVTSQCLMAVPMILLYGLSIGLAYVFGKPPTEAQRAAYRDRKKKPAD